MTALEKAAANLLDEIDASNNPLKGSPWEKALRKALEKPSSITRSPFGTGRREVELSHVHIPDLWHVAHSLDEPHQSMILETWQLAHDMLSNLRGEVES